MGLCTFISIDNKLFDYFRSKKVGKFDLTYGGDQLSRDKIRGIDGIF